MDDLTSESKPIKLFESDHLVVLYRRGTRGSLVVTFNEMGMRAAGLTFWAADFLANEGHSAVGVVTKYPHWFPEIYMVEALEAIRNKVKERTYCDITTYGFSQGAYGALKYAKAVGATRCIALSPQSSIAPEDIGQFDASYAVYYRQLLHRNMLGSGLID